MANLRYVGIGEETEFQTAVAATKYLDPSDENIRPDHGTIFPPHSAYRYQEEYRLGKYLGTGRIVTPVRPTNLTNILKWLLGGVDSNVQGETSAYKHDFTMATSILSFTTRLGLESDEFYYAGCLMQLLRLRILDELLMAENEIIATVPPVKDTIQSEITLNAPRKPFAFHDAAWTVGGGASTEVEELDVTIRNNIPTDWRSGGSRYLPRIVTGYFIVEGTMILDFASTTEVDKFIAGTETSINVVLTGDEIESPYNYAFEIDLPKVLYQADGMPHIRERDRLRAAMAFRALYKSASEYDMEISVTNTETSI